MGAVRCEVTVRAPFRAAVNAVKRQRVYLGADITPEYASKHYITEMPEV